MAKSNEPIWWSLFSAGGMVAALLELRNISLVSYLIIQQSLERKENKGVFYNENLVKLQL